MPDPTQFLSSPDPSPLPMMPHDPILDVPIQVVTMARIGSGTGNGGTTIEGTTPPNRPNTITTVLRPIWVIFIRAAKAFFDAFSGTLAVGTVGDLALPASIQILDVGSAFQLGLAVGTGAAFISVVRSMAELFNKLDQKFPTVFGLS